MILIVLLQLNKTKKYRSELTFKTVIVSFRGTEPFNLVDWSTDLNCELVNFDTFNDGKIGRISGMVHKGFSRGTNDVFDKVYPIVMEHVKENGLFITGHSLGAAIAVIFCSMFVNRNEGNEKFVGGLYTFGQPQVGDQEFINSMNSVLLGKTFRVINDTDIVTREPHLLFPDYCEGPGRAILLDEFGDNFRILEKDQKAPKIDHVIEEVFKSLITIRLKEDKIEEVIATWPRCIRDHYPGFYIFKLEKNLKRSSLETEE